MDGREYSNGHHADVEPDTLVVNPHAGVAEGDTPPEIVDFEMSTDPYANMLPGIANIRAAQTLSKQAMREGRRRPLAMIVSLLLVLVLVLPAILTIISQLTR